MPQVLVPVETLPGSVPGVVDLQQLMEGLRADVEPSIRFARRGGTFFEENGRLPRNVLEDLRASFGRGCSTPSFTRPSTWPPPRGRAAHRLLDPASRGAREYDPLPAR